MNLFFYSDLKKMQSWNEDHRKYVVFPSHLYEWKWTISALLASLSPDSVNTESHNISMLTVIVYHIITLLTLLSNVLN